MANHKNMRFFGRKVKASAMHISIVLLLLFAVCGTIAFLAIRSAEAKNLFVAGHVECSVEADGTVTNNSNIKAYIRAAVAVNWMDSNGNLCGIRPDYSLSVNTGWSEVNHDGIYYYTKPVAVGGKTDTAPVTVTVTGDAPAGYSLSVEYVAEAIQADGTTDIMDVPAIEDAWGVEPFVSN